MDVFLSVMLVLLAAVFLTAGMVKITQSKEKLAANMPWTQEFSSGSVKLLGFVEVISALGLFLPEVTDIAPVLTPVAATGTVLIMIGASVLHMRRGERIEASITLVMLVTAGAVAWGRFGPYSV